MYGKFKRARKTIRRVKKRAVKIYKNPHIRGSAASSITLARDVAYLKSQINAEHKHIDTTFGTEAGQTYSPQQPYRDAPVILPLTLPTKGLNNYDRVGNQIIVNNVTCKLGLIFQNTTDRKSTTTIRSRIIWAKSAADVPVIANLLYPDPNGEYTEMSYVNEQEYKKYIWLKKLDIKKTHQEPSKYGFATTTTPQPPNQAARYYPRSKWNGRIKTEFETGPAANTACTINKPYIFITSNVTKDAAETYAEDPVTLQGTVRLTYIDN